MTLVKLSPPWAPTSTGTFVLLHHQNPEALSNKHQHKQLSAQFSCGEEAAGSSPDWEFTVLPALLQNSSHRFLGEHTRKTNLVRGEPGRFSTTTTTTTTTALKNVLSIAKHILNNLSSWTHHFQLQNVQMNTGTQHFYWFWSSREAFWFFGYRPDLELAHLHSTSNGLVHAVLSFFHYTSS